MAAVVGVEHLRPALPADHVDGVMPRFVVEPASGEAVARVLACVSRAGLTVVSRGGGTKLDWGRAPRRVDLVLSTARLTRLVEHAAGDMTATVQAGCPVATFQRSLAERGQRLALDPLWPEGATIGGILATNDSGALRMRFGSLRDLIIGVTLALSDGTLAKSGGKVVKNVAGYDLPKLATGSFGTLGVITEAVFRLHPLPHGTRDVTFTAASLDALCGLALAIQASDLVVTSLQLRADAAGAGALDVRFEGTPGGLDTQQRTLHELAGDLVPAGPPAAVWRAREALWRGAGPAVTGKFSVLPSRLAECCNVLAEISTAPRLEWCVVAQAFGVGHFRLSGAGPDPLARAVVRLREAVERQGGTVVAPRAPTEVKALLDPWGSPDALPLMRRVKQQLDPAGTLAPGRFVGGI